MVTVPIGSLLRQVTAHVLELNGGPFLEQQKPMLREALQVNPTRFNPQPPACQLEAPVVKLVMRG